MNNAATSKETLLDISVRLAAEKGINAINIRDIAGLGGVSVGCVYNYFPSKANLVASSVGRIWENIFHQADQREHLGGFRVCVRWLFDSIREGSRKYPSFLSAHGMNFAADEIDEGRAVMNRWFEHMISGLLKSLEADPAVREDTFHDGFSKTAFVGFIFDNLMMLSVKQAPNCDFLLELIGKAVC